MIDLIARGIASTAKSTADIANAKADALAGGMHYRGAVDYYDDLPSSPEVGDVYTVKYKGSSGTDPYGAEFAWGEYESVEQWIEIGSSGGDVEGEDILSTGENSGKVLMTNGSGGAEWVADMTDAEIDIAMLEKGDIIKMNLDGTERQYRILKNVSGTTFEVLGLFDSSSGVAYNTSGTGDYSGGALDVALNTTWYGTLNESAKLAIVDKDIVVDGWYWGTSGDPDYNGKYSSTNYQVSLGSSAVTTVGSRHIYALSVQDVLDYLEVTSSMTSSDTTLTDTNLTTMFFYGESTSNSKFVRLRSMKYNTNNEAWTVGGTNPYVYSIYKSYTNGYYARPAFQIDLSKVSYSVV